MSIEQSIVLWRVNYIGLYTYNDGLMNSTDRGLQTPQTSR